VFLLKTDASMYCVRINSTNFIFSRIKFQIFYFLSYNFFILSDTHTHTYVHLVSISSEFLFSIVIQQNLMTILYYVKYKIKINKTGRIDLHNKFKMRNDNRIRRVYFIYHIINFLNMLIGFKKKFCSVTNQHD